MCFHYVTYFKCINQQIEYSAIVLKYYQVTKIVPDEVFPDKLFWLFASDLLWKRV